MAALCNAIGAERLRIMTIRKHAKSLRANMTARQSAIVARISFGMIIMNISKACGRYSSACQTRSVTEACFYRMGFQTTYAENARLN